MAGDIGFDPLQISDLVPLAWSREVRARKMQQQQQQQQQQLTESRRIATAENTTRGGCRSQGKLSGGRVAYTKDVRSVSIRGSLSRVAARGTTQHTLC